MLVCAIVLDAAALAAFLLIKGQADPAIVGMALVAIAAIFVFERGFLSRQHADDTSMHHR